MIEHALLLTAAVGTVLVYVFRLNHLKFSQHRTVYLALHIWLGTTAATVGVGAWEHNVTPPDVCALLVSIVYLIVSWRTWRYGPPGHVRR